MSRSQYMGIGLLVAVVACIGLALSSWVSLRRVEGDPQALTQAVERTEWMRLLTRTMESTWTVATFAFEKTWTPLGTKDLTPTVTNTPCPNSAPCPTSTPFALPTLPTFEPTWTKEK